MSVQRFVVRVGDRSYEVELDGSSSAAPGGGARVLVEGHAFEVLDAPGGATIVRDADGTVQRRAVVDDRAHPSEVIIRGESIRLEVKTAQQAAMEDALAAASGGAGEGRVEAPMPGQVVKVAVTEGQSVELDDPVIIVEAMKMENELRAPVAGTVASIAVAAGEAVDAGQLLVEIVPHPEDPA